MDADAVLREWLHRTGEYSPDYYAYYGPDETSEAIRSFLDRALGPGAAVLELGCSSGRHLAHLHEHGYRDLHGVEINADALDVMADAYPDLADAGTFHIGAIEAVVPEFEDGRFDAVYSVETLQHVHRDNEWVFGEIARIAGDVLLTAEIERPADEKRDGSAGGDRPAADPAVTYVDDGVPLYYRDWGRIFAGLGLVEVEARSLGRETFRAFRRDPA